MTMKTKDKIVNFLSENAGKMFETIEIQDHISGSWNHVRTTVAELANEGVINRKKKDSDKRAYLYYLEYCDLRSQVYNKDHIKDHVCKPERDGVLENRDPGSEKNGFHNNGKGREKTKMPGSQDHKAVKDAQSKQNATDPQTDPRRSFPNFFGDLHPQGSNNFLIGENTNNTVNGTYQENHLARHSLAKFKKGDRVKYLGDQPIHKGKTFEVTKIYKESFCDFSYICVDVTKPKGTTVRLQEDKLKLVKDEH